MTIMQMDVFLLKELNIDKEKLANFINISKQNN